MKNAKIKHLGHPVPYFIIWKKLSIIKLKQPHLSFQQDLICQFRIIIFHIQKRQKKVTSTKGFEHSYHTLYDLEMGYGQNIKVETNIMQDLYRHYSVGCKYHPHPHYHAVPSHTE